MTDSKVNQRFSAASWMEVQKVSGESLQYLLTGDENFRSTRFLATFTIK